MENQLLSERNLTLIQKPFDPEELAQKIRESLFQDGQDEIRLSLDVTALIILEVARELFLKRSIHSSIRRMGSQMISKS